MAAREKRQGRHKGKRIKPPQDEPRAEEQINLTDSDSALMRKNKRSEYRQCYNAQAVVDAEGSQLILGSRVSRCASDRGELVQNVDAMPEVLGMPERVLADNGYATGSEVAELERRGLEVLVAVGAEARRRVHDFRPPVADKPAKEFHTEWLRRMHSKMAQEENRAHYRLRKQTVEPVFGMVKEAMGFRRFLLRGLQKVEAEWALVTLAYNCKRLKASRMIESHEELLKIADSLDGLVKRGRQPEIQDPLERLEEAVQKVKKSWSGSWLGYHANVYYEGLAPRPPGAHFSQEWGLTTSFVRHSTSGHWVEYDPDEVKTATRKLAGNPNLEPSHEFCEEAMPEFETMKSTVASILETELEKSSDTFLNRLKNDLEKLSYLNQFEILESLKPGGQIMTRDSLAAGQGIWVPPHMFVLSEALEIGQTVGIIEKLSELARQAGSHLSRQQRRNRRAETMGTNIFIGHGRSQDWRELKDFIEDRLRLPVDEFNRVSVAGVTNVARLSEMIDAAVFAFLVMTGEDEQPDGKLRARMNVVHEAGLFQGRLGFARAIVLLEEGCEEFSNMSGLGQIRFPRGKIKSTFEEIREVLEHEGVLSADE